MCLMCVMVRHYCISHFLFIIQQLWWLIKAATSCLIVEFQLDIKSSSSVFVCGSLWQMRLIFSPRPASTWPRMHYYTWDKTNKEEEFKFIWIYPTVFFSFLFVLFVTHDLCWGSHCGKKGGGNWIAWDLFLKKNAYEYKVTWVRIIATVWVLFLHVCVC